MLSFKRPATDSEDNRRSNGKRRTLFKGETGKKVGTGEEALWTGARGQAEMCLGEAGSELLRVEGGGRTTSSGSAVIV